MKKPEIFPAVDLPGVVVTAFNTVSEASNGAPTAEGTSPQDPSPYETGAPQEEIPGQQPGRVEPAG